MFYALQKVRHQQHNLHGNGHSFARQCRKNGFLVMCLFASVLIEERSSVSPHPIQTNLSKLIHQAEQANQAQTEVHIGLVGHVGHQESPIFIQFSAGSQRSSLRAPADVLCELPRAQGASSRRLCPWGKDSFGCVVVPDSASKWGTTSCFPKRRSRQRLETKNAWRFFEDVWMSQSNK